MEDKRLMVISNDQTNFLEMSLKLELTFFLSLIQFLIIFIIHYINDVGCRMFIK